MDRKRAQLLAEIYRRDLISLTEHVEAVRQKWGRYAGKLTRHLTKKQIAAIEEAENRFHKSVE